jgi:hypothetical protein
MLAADPRIECMIGPLDFEFSIFNLRYANIGLLNITLQVLS